MVGVQRRGKQYRVKLHTYYSLLSSNRTQIILIIIALFPSIILFGFTFASLWYYQNQSLVLIQNFAEQLFQDQINNSKMQNSALLFQINQQVQTIAWEMNLMNECYHNVLLGVILKNKNHIPALQNQDRAYYDNEDPVVLSLFKQNELLTGVWHHISKSYMSQLDERSVSQLLDASRMDTILRPILYDNNIEVIRQMKISAIYFGHSYDGMIYMNSQNSTYEGYEPPSWCPYTGPFYLDVRCRFYYMPTIMGVSTQIFSPQLQYGGINGSTYLATAYCQRRLRYQAADPNSPSINYGVLCMAIDLSLIPQYFQNFGSNSKFQMFLDPRELSVVYDSLRPLLQSQIATVQDFETKYLQDQTQAKKFLDNISQNYQFILSNTSTIDLSNTFDINQPTFEYNRNGTECFVIMNTVKMIDMVPKYEYLRKVNPSSKYQIKSVYLFLDVLSKQQMQQYSSTLQNTIKTYNLIFTYVSWGIIVFLLAIQFYYSILLGKQILSPLIHLTNILKQIRIQNKNLVGKTYSQHSHHALSQQSEYNPSMYNDSESSNNEILIDEQLDADVDGVCFSSDTQILLESFQNMFKILRFTTQNFYKENESNSLLNLNIQIEHFQQFGNYRAMGVCHNNMGVIHYNCGRYQEAVEHFQKAIIYAKYELNTYSHDNNGNTFWGKVHRYSVSLRNSCQTNQSSCFDSINLSQNMNTNVDKSQANTEKQHFYWNLYNRNENYLKALSLYIRTHKNNLWETFIEIAYENTSLSQIFLPPSFKREVMNFYAISIGYNQLSLSENNSQILQRIDKLYRSSVSKINIAPESSFSTSKILHSQSPHFCNNPSFIASQTDHVGALVQSLLSPLKKNKKELLKNHSQTPKINYLFDTSYSNKFAAQNQKHFNFNPAKNNVLKSYDPLAYTITPMNLKETLPKSIYPKPHEKYVNVAKLQDSIVQDDSQLYLVKQYSINESLSNEKKQNQELTQKDLEDIIKGGLKNAHSDQNHHLPKLKMRNKLGSLSQYQNINSLQDSSCSELKTLQTSDRVQRYQKTKVSISEKQKQRDEKINQKTKRSQLTSSIFNRNKGLSNYALNHSIISSKLDSSSQMDNQVFKTFVNSMKRKIQSSVYAKINYPVRKMKSDEKISSYEFNSDIIFFFYALQQSKYFISQNDFYSAAQLLSNVLEKTKYYLPHHKIQILELLSSIFKKNHIESTDLKEMTRKYRKYKNYDFHICLISSCHKTKNKEKVYALSQDFTQEILFKQKDTFGLLSYSFEEHLYLQLMSFTSIQTIKSNFLFFEYIFRQLFQKQNNINPEYSKEGNLKRETTNLKRETTNFQPPISEQSFLNETHKNNSFEQEHKEFKSTKLQNKYSKNSNVPNIAEKTENTAIDHKHNIFLQQSQQQQIQPQQKQCLISEASKTPLHLEKEAGDQSRMGNSYSHETILQAAQNNETANDSIQQNYYLIDMEKQISKSTEENSKINALILQSDQSSANNKIFPYQNSSINQRKNFLLKPLKLEEQSFSFNDFQNNSLTKSCHKSDADQEQQQQHSFIQNNKFSNNSFLEKTNQLITEGNSKEAKPPQQTVSSTHCVLFDKNDNIPPHSQTQQSLQKLTSDNLSTNIQQTEIQQNNSRNNLKQVQEYKKGYSHCMAENLTSEQVFHQGVNAAIKQFVLNTEQKLTNYLTRMKFYDRSKNSPSSSKFKTMKKSQVYLIYVTDQPLVFKQKYLLNYLCEFLINLEIELLVLEINENQSCEEFSLLQNIVLQGKSVITFFHTEAKLLQYIYSTREHLKNDIIPMIFEHF